jgi:hypothetical protein
MLGFHSIYFLARLTQEVYASECVDSGVKMGTTSIILLT